MLKITVKGQELTMDEARELYRDLAKIFGPKDAQPEPSRLQQWLEQQDEQRRRIEELERSKTVVIGPGSGYGPYIGGGQPWFGVVPPFDPLNPMKVTCGVAAGGSCLTQN